jgi:hypothetical protein
METEKRCKIHPTEDVILELTPTGKHHGKWLCAECKKFVVWSKQPKTSELMIERQQTIADILRNNITEMSDKDLHMALKLYSLIHLTLVPEENYRRLKEKYLTKGGV